MSPVDPNSAAAKRNAALDAAAQRRTDAMRGPHKPGTIGAALAEREQSVRFYTVPRDCAAAHVAAFIRHKDLADVRIVPHGLTDCRIIITLWK